MGRLLVLACLHCFLAAMAAVAADIPGPCKPHFKLPTKGFPKVAVNPHAAARPAVSGGPWSMAPLCQAYQFPTGLAGGGVIGILELGGGYSQADLDAFSAANGLPKIVVQDISVDGTVNSPSNPPADADYEVTIDIQIAAASYYYATGKMPTIKMFFASNSFYSFSSVVQSAVNNKCSVLSISWGAPEIYWQYYANGALQQLESDVTNAAASGLTVLAASGDYSSSDYYYGNNVDAPSSCPHIIACGGTSKTSSSEVVWGDGYLYDTGTGGGFSSVFPVQAFQIGAPSGGGRMVPDIAAEADPNVGYEVVVGGSQFPIGGTSCVAPLYSGLFAACAPNKGFITPTLWKNPSAFTDITQGSNGGFNAAVGPDPCTGLGVPKGSAIAALFGSGGGGGGGSNYVVATYTSSTNTLKLTDDPGSNSITLTQSKGKVLVQVKGNTLLGTPAKNTKQMTFNVSPNLKLDAEFTAGGNNTLSLIGLSSSTTVINMGSGNDSMSLGLCNIGTLTVNGGAGTDTLVITGSKIKHKTVTGVP